MTTIDICGKTITLGHPTTGQALRFLSLAERIWPAINTEQDPSLDRVRELKAKLHGQSPSIDKALLALGFDGAHDVLELVAEITDIPVAEWSSKPIHETLSAVITIANAWMPVLQDYFNNQLTPAMEALAKVG